MGYEYNVGAQIGFVFVVQLLSGLMMITE